MCLEQGWAADPRLESLNGADFNMSRADAKDFVSATVGLCPIGKCSLNILGLRSETRGIAPKTNQVATEGRRQSETFRTSGGTAASLTAPTAHRRPGPWCAPTDAKVACRLIDVLAHGACANLSCLINCVFPRLHFHRRGSARWNSRSRGAANRECPIR